MIMLFLEVNIFDVNRMQQIWNISKWRNIKK